MKIVLCCCYSAHPAHLLVSDILTIYIGYISTCMFYVYVCFSIAIAGFTTLLSTTMLGRFEQNLMGRIELVTGSVSTPGLAKPAGL